MKKNLNKIDFLIIGAGMAGSILAFKLLNAGKKVVLVNAPHIPSASRVAAGLINPISGQRLVLQNDFDVLFAEAKRFYQEFSKLANARLLNELSMIRIIRSEKEAHAYAKRNTDCNYENYIGSFHTSPTTKMDNFTINTPLGCFEQTKTAWLDTNALLDGLYRILETSMYFEAFNYDDMLFNEKYIQWKAFEANHIIFCEGWNAINNPWFNYLPFQPAKGEILSIRSQQILPRYIFNYGNWLLPQQKYQAKIGASYDWDNLDVTISHANKEKLLFNFHKLFKEKVALEVTQQLAGIRPGVIDKQALLGSHPVLKNMSIFNGFGSKGSLFIPYFANKMSDYLLFKQALPKQVDINRHIKLFTQ